MGNRFGIFGVALCTLLTACGTNSSQSNAEKATLAALKDPSSAQFGEFTKYGDHGSYSCLSVNAKNTFGGYTGVQQATLKKNINEEWQVESIDDVSHEACIQALHDKCLLYNQHTGKTC